MFDYPELVRQAKADGMAQVGFSHLEGLLPPALAHLPYGITLVFALSSQIVAPVADGPTYPYFQHYRTANAFLDSWALRAAARLELAGYRALPVAASQSIPPREAYRGLFPHKTAAVAAGLGWIGKSALLVTPKWGPRVRLATVLTDCPLPVEERPAYPGCGDCTVCRDACPAGAITGRKAGPGRKREDFYSPELCSKHMKTYQHIGRGAVCGICMARCPVGMEAKSALL